MPPNKTVTYTHVTINHIYSLTNLWDKYVIIRTQCLLFLICVCHPSLPMSPNKQHQPRKARRETVPGTRHRVLTGSLVKPALQEALQGSSHRLSCREFNHKLHTEFSGFKKKKEEEDHRPTVGPRLPVLSPGSEVGLQPRPSEDGAP